VLGERSDVIQRASLALLFIAALFAAACASSSRGERAMEAVRQALVSPGAKLVFAQLECDARSDDGSLWTVSCAPGPRAEYETKPAFHVNVEDLSVAAANEDGQRLLAVSERLKGGNLHECTLDEAIAGTLRLTCKK
jgi:hypothetical protein